jgi:hypothetical protein
MVRLRFRAALPVSILSCLSGVMFGCAATGNDVVRPLSRQSLYKLLNSSSPLAALDGKRVEFSAVLFSIDTHWGIVDLRASKRAVTMDQAGLSLEGDCIDLISPTHEFHNVPSSAITRITGTLLVADSISNDVVTSMKTEGVEFSPRCNYVADRYILLRAERFE